MTKVLTEATFIQDATLKIDTDNYESAITSAAIVPTYPNPTIAIDGTQHPGKPRWVATIGFLQDLTNQDSLANYLFDKEGAEKEMTFVPEDGGPEITATIRILSGQLGGQANQNATATVSLPVSGRPTITHSAG